MRDPPPSAPVPEAPPEPADLVRTRLVEEPAPLVVGPQPLPADRNPALVLISRMTTPKSKSAVRMSLALVVEAATSSRVDPALFPWHLLRYQHARAILARLVEDEFAPATVNHALSVIRGVVREAWQLGLVSSDDMLKVCAPGALRPVKGSTLPAGRYVADEEVARLLRAATSAHDAALVAVLFGAGPRRAEVAGLELGDYRRATRELVIRHGKGHKQRVVPLAWPARPLETWLRERGKDGCAAIFLESKGIAIPEWRVAATLSLIAAAAKVDHVTPHDARRTFISNVIEVEGVEVARMLAGHENVQITLRYDRRPETIKRRAVDKLRNPLRLRPRKT